MKIGTQEESVGVLDDLIPQNSPVEKKTSSLGKVLDQAAESVAEKASEQIESILTPQAIQFFRTHRINRGDIGQTAYEVFVNSQEELIPPSEFEADILDAILFKGRYEREFTVGRIPFVITTTNAKLDAVSRRILQSYYKKDPDGFPAFFNCMAVARNLVSVNGNLLCAYDADQPEFYTSEAAIQERLDKVLDMPIELLDVIGTRVNEFVRVTSMSLVRNLSDF